jgi:hypothetical protein
VRSCDVAQQALFAQHPGMHAFSLGVFVTMHGAAGNRTVAVKSASPTATETVILLRITLPYSTISAAGRIFGAYRGSNEPAMLVFGRGVFIEKLQMIRF